MGGAGYIFTGNNDADIMHNSASINLMMLDQVVKHSFGPKPRIFYSSSACMYPEHNQLDPDNPNCEESSAYPANPDSEYGWEKLFSERMYLAYARNFNLKVRIARFHNIYGPEGTWRGGKEKAPAAICRKVIEATDTIDVWGDGLQTRSFLYIDECVEGVRRLMQSDFQGPVNIGSDEMVTINDLVKMACNVEHKQLRINHINGPTGVRGRNSDNTLIKQKLGWAPNYALNKGIEQTYRWIKSQMEQK
jgi:nucleoside-diphosphate-sugar epimerase